MPGRSEPAVGRAAGRRFETSLITNGVTWFLRSALVVDDTRLTVVTPRTLLGLVPVGIDKWSLDTHSLAGTRVGAKLHPDRLAAAMVLVLLTVFAEIAVPASVVLVIGAVAMLLVSLVAVLRVESQDGTVHTVPICLIHIPRARRFAAVIETMGREAGPTGGSM